MTKDHTKFFNQTQEIRAYIAQRAAKHEGLTPQVLFDEIPNHLKDNPKEIMDYLSREHGDEVGVQISHIQSKNTHPELSGDPNNIVLEVSGEEYGYPNQVRQDNPINDIEVERIIAENKDYALQVEACYTDDLPSNLTPDPVSNNFTPDLEMSTDLAISHNYDGLADSIYVGLNGISQTLGVACTYSLMRTYAPRIIALFRYIVHHRVELMKSRSQREKLIRDCIMPMIQREDADQVGSSFIVGLLLALIPGIRELLVAYGLVSMCKLAMPYVKKFVIYLEQHFPALAKLIHWVVIKIDKLVDVIHYILDNLWQMVEEVARRVWEGSKQTRIAAVQSVQKMVNGVKQTIQVAKDCLVSCFEWGWDTVRSLFGGNRQKSIPSYS